MTGANAMQGLKMVLEAMESGVSRKRLGSGRPHPFESVHTSEAHTWHGIIERAIAEIAAERERYAKLEAQLLDRIEALNDGHAELTIEMRDQIAKLEAENSEREQWLTIWKMRAMTREEP